LAVHASLLANCGLGTYNFTRRRMDFFILPKVATWVN
jgi:hypothetical protein